MSEINEPPFRSIPISAVSSRDGRIDVSQFSTEWHEWFSDLFFCVNDLAATTNPLFTSTTPGIVPASGGGTVNFLRADGTWAAPPGGGGITDGDKGDITVSGGGTIWTIDPLTITLAKLAADTTAEIAGKAATVHSHAQGDVVNLVTDLAGKAPLVHLHDAADVTTGTMATARLGSGTANATTFLRGDQTWATPAGGGGGAQGSATIDFGAAPGTNIVTVAVTGQAAIVAGSQAQAFLMGNDSTAQHNADEHGFLARYIDFACESIVASTGFTIRAITELRLTGTFVLRWRWS